jgi:hypothetical protein
MAPTTKDKKTPTNAHTSSITQKILMGTMLTSEWKMHLHQSSAWKQMQVLPKDQQELCLATHSGKEYIAFLVGSEPLSLEAINALKQQFCEKLTRVCPKQNTSQVPVVLFTQLFVA